MGYDYYFGSKTAKGGFDNEKIIADKFRSWKNDKEAQEWLKIMGYNLEEIEELKAIVIPVKLSKKEMECFGLEKDEDIEFKKADVQIRLLIKIKNLWKIENISLKRISTGDYNQVDKRKVDSYKRIWDFNEDIATSLKLFTGEINPLSFKNYQNYIKVSPDKLKDKKQRRIFLNELKDDKLKAIIDFFKNKKHLVVADVLRGRGALSAGWLMVVKYNNQEDITQWGLAEINIAVNLYCEGEVELTKYGSLSIGKVIMQRKGGTPDPTKLQFKIKPSLLFSLSDSG